MFKISKHCFTLFLVLHLSYIILGQNYFVSNLYNNLVFSNPAYAQFNDYSVAQLNYRNQWPVSNTYTSYGVSYFHNIENLNSNFGAIINYDNQYKGTFTQTAIGLNYAYKLRTGRETHFLFGLQAYYNLASTNYSKLIFENQLTSPTNNERKKYPTINSGFGFLIKNEHFIGISVNNLLGSSTPPINTLLYSASYVGRIKLKNYYSEVFIEPILHISTNLNYIQFQYGSNINYSGLKAGVLINQTAINLNTFIILLGISFENYDFVYTYDINLSGAITINPKMAAHEVTFLKKFQYKGRRKRHKAIKCPDI